MCLLHAVACAGKARPRMGPEGRFRAPPWEPESAPRPHQRHRTPGPDAAADVTSAQHSCRQPRPQVTEIRSLFSWRKCLVSQFDFLSVNTSSPITSEEHRTSSVAQEHSGACARADSRTRTLGVGCRGCRRRSRRGPDAAADRDGPAGGERPSVLVILNEDHLETPGGGLPGD